MSESGKQKQGAGPTVPATGEKAGKTGEAPQGKAREVGGRAGPEPTRYGDWEVKGICVDF